jgi:hypothetical protein
MDKFFPNNYDKSAWGFEVKKFFNDINDKYSYYVWYIILY